MKRIICLTLIISLLICPVFAFADSDMTIQLMDDAGIDSIEESAVKIAAATADPTHVVLDSYSTSGTYYLYYPRNGLMQTESYPSGYYYLPGLFSGLSYSIAHNIQLLISAIPSYSTVLSNISGYVDGLESTLSTISSRLSSTNSYIDSIESYIDSLESYTDGIEGSLSSILSAIQNQSLTIPQSLLDDVDSLASNQVKPSDLSSYFSWGYGSNNATYTLPRYRQHSNGGSTSDLTPTVRAYNIFNQVWYAINNINQSMVYGFRDMLQGVSASSHSYYDKDLNSISLGRNSLWFDLRTLGSNINNIVARLGFVLANDEDIEARQAAAATTEAAIDDYISGSGNASVSASDLGDLASFTHSVTNMSGMGLVGPDEITDTLNSSSPWVWFTNDTLYALEPSLAQRGSSKLFGSESDTPLLDSNIADIKEALGL